MIQPKRDITQVARYNPILNSHRDKVQEIVEYLLHHGITGVNVFIHQMGLL